MCEGKLCTYHSYDKKVSIDTNKVRVSYYIVNTKIRLFLSKFRDVTDCTVNDCTKIAHKARKWYKIFHRVDFFLLLYRAKIANIDVGGKC